MLPLISRVYLLDPIGIKLISLIVLLTTGLELFDYGVTHPSSIKPITMIPKSFFIYAGAPYLKALQKPFLTA
jgi:hypothetical protein